MAELTEAQRAFIAENPYVGTATTLREDGSPHSTVVWVDANGDLSFNTARGRAKERHIARDPRISLLVIARTGTYKWVAVRGRGEIVDAGADAAIDTLAKKYIGQETYPWRSADEQRVTVRITPEKVDSAGFDS